MFHYDVELSCGLCQALNKYHFLLASFKVCVKYTLFAGKKLPRRPHTDCCILRSPRRLNSLAFLYRLAQILPSLKSVYLAKIPSILIFTQKQFMFYYGLIQNK